jgi:hypothetical protein
MQHAGKCITNCQPSPMRPCIWSYVINWSAPSELLPSPAWIRYTERFLPHITIINPFLILIVVGASRYPFCSSIYSQSRGYDVKPQDPLISFLIDEPRYFTPTAYWQLWSSLRKIVILLFKFTNSHRTVSESQVWPRSIEYCSLAHQTNRDPHFWSLRGIEAISRHRNECRPVPAPQ